MMYTRSLLSFARQVGRNNPQRRGLHFYINNLNINQYDKYVLERNSRTSWVNDSTNSKWPVTPPWISNPSKWPVFDLTQELIFTKEVIYPKLNELNGKLIANIIDNDIESVKNLSVEADNDRILLKDLLHYAISYKRNDIAKLLIKKISPYELDSRFGEIDLEVKLDWQMEEIIKNNTGPTPLIIAAMVKNIEMAEILAGFAKHIDFNKQADLVKPNNTEYKHYSQVAALHYAAVNNDIDMANLLINNGALIDIQNVAGETPLLMAVWKGHIEMVKLLLKNKADPLVKNYFKVPMWALTDNIEINYLLEKGMPKISTF